MTALYNVIGENYDTTRRADPEITETLVRLLSLQGNNRYLDIACGTGNYTVALAAKGGSWSGVDVSAKMLEEAREKSTDIFWREGSVDALPYEAGTFDGAICTLAIHHFPNLEGAFAEIGRILKPNAPFVLFTTAPEQTAAYWLSRYFPKMIERSAAQMPGLGEITKLMAQGGMAVTETVPFFVTPALQDFFLYSGKDRPELYLSPQVRSGISSFAKLVDDDELENGLALLEKEINDGSIHQVIADYRNDLGDYLFVKGVKG